MKVGIEWLKQFSDIDVSLKDLSEILTMTGSKVEGYESKGDDIKNVVVGKILEIEKHPDADKLIVTKVNVGDEILQIVTGAKNVKEGDIIPIAKIGAELPGGTKIKKGKLRGVESNGMMCSIGELNLKIEDYPDQIEDGIMILNSIYEKDLGKDIVDVLNLKEDIIEFEITPNRPDCLAVEGLGREVAVSLGKEYKNVNKSLNDMKVPRKDEIEGLKVDIEAPDLCYRYMARVIKNVKIGPSPEWMKKRLMACGVRSINNIVDITNYVMLEMGQPMHAFDINSISGREITVRRAKKGEKITTLDEQERELTDEMLVIADNTKPVAVAGVMGGINSGIEENTNTVVFESAIFKRGSVRLTAKQLGLRTEASSRYEKGLPQENAERAINRAVQLAEELGAGKAVDAVIDVYPTKQKIQKVEFNPERINKLLGINLSRDEMVEILNKLEIKVDGNYCIPPYYRQDIEQSADVAEEILRIYGYDKLGSTLINAETTLGARTEIQKLSDKIQEMLVSNGFSEVYTYGFINPEELEKVNIHKGNKLYDYTIKIKNPLSVDYSIMKTTVVPTMMKVVASNIAKKNTELMLFEHGKVYQDTNEFIEKEELPIETNIVTLALTGKNVDFYTLKGFVENVLEVSNIARYDVVSDSEESCYHPGRTAKIMIGNDSIAVLGQIHPYVQANYEVNMPIYMAEINFDKLTKYARKEKKYIPIPKFPAVERDIALTVDEEIEVAKIEKAIKSKGKKILESMEVFDIYRSPKLGLNKKSIAIALKFRSKDRTLTEEEINSVMEQILDELAKIGAELRK